MLKNSILLLGVASTVTSKGMRNILLGWFFVNFYALNVATVTFLSLGSATHERSCGGIGV